jgi:transcriptional regulator with GAF, ATPase, and Fis domain
MAMLIASLNDVPIQEKILFKSLTTIGSDIHADIQIDDQKIPSVAAHISHQSQSFTLIATEPKFPIKINDRTFTTHVLKDQDQITIGGFKIKFYANSSGVSEEYRSQHYLELNAYKRLLQFSKKLAKEEGIPQLLNALMDEIIAVTHAEKGFLVLYENEIAKVKVARNVQGESLEKTVDELSDSILAKVLQSKSPIVVSDALHDAEFKASSSVINLKLTSVMCVPLMHQGTLFGAIYLGNNSFINAFDSTSLELLTIFASQASLLVQHAFHINALTEQTNHLKASLEFTKFGGIIGSCSHMQQVFSNIDKIASTDVSVLIFGETGTGKELIARELHRRSGRAMGPFAVINCGAIPENLLESELFGHVRGAFTGAVTSRIGRFQAAHHGTLFLDEIGEMPQHLQVKILRALQDHRITRVGDEKSEEIDIRILAATNRDLSAMVKKGTFREDLYYRLNVVEIDVPPLRQRGNDALVIANYFLQKYSKIYGKDILGLSEQAQNAILNYDWPGNVRQLENRIRRAIVMSEGKRINPVDLDISNAEISSTMSLSDALEKFRQQYIADALERNAGNRTQTAKELGIDPRTIFRHLEDKRKQSEKYVS